MRGLSDTLPMPVSRHTETRAEDLPVGVYPLLTSEEAGLGMLHEPKARRVYIFNHLEYDHDTLSQEYLRDKQTGKAIHVPANYYPQDQVDERPSQSWRSHAHLLFSNWINSIYQDTPYNLNQLGSDL